MSLRENGEGFEGEDMARLIEDAYNAARRGALEDLELLLARLRLVAPEKFETLGEKLRMIANCVRAHPSFTDQGSEESGGEGRAAV